MTIAIRPAAPEDGAGIWSMLKPVFQAGDTYTIDPGIDERTALSYWLSSRAFVAEDGVDLLGTYYIRPNQAGGGAHVCNCGYVTAEVARGKGVARAMLSHSLDVARAMGFRAMQYNFVVATNTRAIDTWTRAGFQTVGRLPGAFNHPTEGYVDALVMWKDLADAP